MIKKLLVVVIEVATRLLKKPLHTWIYKADARGRRWTSNIFLGLFSQPQHLLWLLFDVCTILFVLCCRKEDAHELLIVYNPFYFQGDQMWLILIFWLFSTIFGSFWKLNLVTLSIFMSVPLACSLSNVWVIFFHSSNLFWIGSTRQSIKALKK